MRLGLPAAAGYGDFRHDAVRVDRPLQLAAQAVVLRQQEVPVVALGTGAQIGKRRLQDGGGGVRLPGMDQHGVVVRHASAHVRRQLRVGGRPKIMALGGRRADSRKAGAQSGKRLLTQAGVVRGRKRTPMQVGRLAVPAERLGRLRRSRQGAPARLAAVVGYLPQRLQAGFRLPLRDQVLAVPQAGLRRHQSARRSHAQLFQGGRRVFDPASGERPVDHHVQDLLRQIDATGAIRAAGRAGRRRFPDLDSRKAGREELPGVLLPVEPQRAEGGSIERGRHLRRVGVAISEPQIGVAGGFVAAALIEGGRIQIGRLGRDRGVRRPRGDRQRFGRLFGFAQAVVDAAQRQVAIRFPHAAAHAITQNAPRLLVLAGVEQLRPQRQAGAPVQLPLRRGLHHLAVEVGGAPVLAARTVDAADAVHPLQ